jgi:hypothetical protein
MARNRLDFGPPPPSAGGAGAVTPAAATAKGPDIGPTPAHPAPLARSPETSSLAPLSRVLEPAGAGAGAGLAQDSEGANPPITPPRPPRPPDRGRELGTRERREIIVGSGAAPKEARGAWASACRHAGPVISSNCSFGRICSLRIAGVRIWWLDGVLHARPS